MKLEKGVTTHEEMILDLIEKVKELMAKVEVIEKKIEDKAIPEYLSASCPCSPTRFLTKDIGRICWRCDYTIFGDEREYGSVM